MDQTRPARWISVKSKLPDTGTEVLICTAEGRIKIAELWDEGTWIETHEYCVIDNVTHWASLPLPAAQPAAAADPHPRGDTGTLVMPRTIRRNQTITLSPRAAEPRAIGRLFTKRRKMLSADDAKTVVIRLLMDGLTPHQALTRLVDRNDIDDPAGVLLDVLGEIGYKIPLESADEDHSQPAGG